VGLNLVIDLLRTMKTDQGVPMWKSLVDDYPMFGTEAEFSRAAAIYVAFTTPTFCLRRSSKQPHSRDGSRVMVESDGLPAPS